MHGSSTRRSPRIVGEQWRRTPARRIPSAHRSPGPGVVVLRTEGPERNQFLTTPFTHEVIVRRERVVTLRGEGRCVVLDQAIIVGQLFEGVTNRRAAGLPRCLN